MPPELREQVEESARANNRSLNSELIDRIQKSFSQVQWEKLDDPDLSRVEISNFTKMEIDDYAKKYKLSFEEALAKIVAAGTDPNAPFVMYVRVPERATLQEVRQIMLEAKSHAPDDATVYFDSYRKQK
ncbi:hypothetical protein AT395_00390 [Pandoraea apista]|nr:hypothetical protein AT395_00390 [Pandoraea apista]